MSRKWSKLFGGECEHEHLLVVTSVGVRRSVCEACGHISFKMADQISTAQRPTKPQDLPKASGL